MSQGRIRDMILNGYDLAEISTLLMIPFADVVAVKRQIDADDAARLKKALLKTLHDIPPAKVAKLAATEQSRAMKRMARGDCAHQAKGKKFPPRDRRVAVEVAPLPRQHGFRMDEL